ncbi:MAG: hypothetical protein GF307_05085 [candidate division Zixibacteria bacterium]|nr:hypothetical protein [candidate division Zixibacteria bacterium]
MLVFTDNVDFAREVMKASGQWYDSNYLTGKENIDSLREEFFKGKPNFTLDLDKENYWKYLFIVKYAEGSHYDLLIKLAQENFELPDLLLALAGEGRGFHGHKKRTWATLPGNIHLCVSLRPNKKIERFHVGYTILTAISAVQTIDGLPGMESSAGIKWVNDILIDGSKVCGVLAHTQSQGDKVTNVTLGIGMNIMSSPDVEPTPFVPNVGAVIDYADHKGRWDNRDVFLSLRNNLARNNEILMNGGYRKLLRDYIERSVIIGKEVSIYADSETQSLGEPQTGVVEAIGDNLELYLSGFKKPISSGRLVLNR